MHASFIWGDRPRDGTIGQGILPQLQPLTSGDASSPAPAAAVPTASLGAEMLSDDDLEHVVGGLTRPLLEDLVRAPLGHA